ncbi:MAG TPA: hypothetical protein VFL66_08655 [Gaiellaceae bacterium]|nr:hypothetical protein [Gaiellaceae bacterium]
MALVEDWHAIEQALPAGWGDARLRLALADDAASERAAALLGPLNPWRTGAQLRFFAVSSGVGPRSDAIERALGRLDRERIAGTLELVAADTAPAAPEISRPTLVAAWDAARATLPPDWSDLYVEVDLLSSDYLARASLQMSPLAARREGGKPALRFRCAARRGYGAAPQMVRRCLERCDEDGIRGELRILRVLCDTQHAATQGPVWQIGGRTV